MPITYKSKDEIAVLREGGLKLGAILERLERGVASGQIKTTGEIDVLAEKWILEAGGRPAFKGYGSPNASFPCAICVSVNNEVVHGVPSHEHHLKTGDVVGLDIGMIYPAKGRGLYTDTALTVIVGRGSKKSYELVDATRESLYRAIAVAEPGAKISDIGATVQEYIKPFGFGIVRQYVGHGVGYEVHEEPKVPNYVDPKSPVVEMKPGLVIAIEPMITSGGSKVFIDKDGWTVKTEDGSLAAHFEHTIAITEKGAEVLTRRPSETI
ncbi:MAG: methionine aminopeptidase, type I [Candidatus Magasanikbacteria bacterium]|nr:methionine aminopeptidase, type I [Candidatus Magasanikbacteria bacterium]